MLRTAAITMAMMLSLICMSFSGCCQDTHTEPNRPPSVEGWKERREGGVRTLATLLLKEGEATDNGVVQVELIDIVPHDPCAAHASTLSVARAKVRFSRVSDQHVLCEETFREGSNAGFGISYCNKELVNMGFGAINMRGIHEKENWAYFDLIGFW
jgi:hypothetical protein